MIRDKMHFTMCLDKGERVRLVNSGPEYDALLRQKLDEEFKEFAAEVDHNFDARNDHMVQEAADLIDVIATLVQRYTNCKLDEIIGQLVTKRNYKGGFDAGVVLESKR
jgi:predicted house-cleaning noncanonical NTP pyrophosphatase (MazG superfamily)